MRFFLFLMFIGISNFIFSQEYEECQQCGAKTVIGDANHDNKLNIADVTYVVDLLLERIKPTKTEKIEAVDLALPSGKLWANMNIGSVSATDPGSYFGWGECEEHDMNNLGSYKYYSISGNINAALSNKITLNITKYTTYADRNLQPEDDAATILWGEEWEMPTYNDFEELINSCMVFHTTINGVKGVKFMGGNGNSVFFPLGGFKYEPDYWLSNEDNISNLGVEGYYWTRNGDINNAFSFYATNSSTSFNTKTQRHLGLNVRPIKKVSQ